MEIGGTNPSVPDFDQLVVIQNASSQYGEVTFGGTLKIRFINGFLPQIGQSFRVFQFHSSQGQFNTYDFPDLSAQKLRIVTKNIYMHTSCV